jgi:hypothetical protein
LVIDTPILRTELAMSGALTPMMKMALQNGVSEGRISNSAMDPPVHEQHSGWPPGHHWLHGYRERPSRPQRNPERERGDGSPTASQNDFQSNHDREGVAVLGNGGVSAIPPNCLSNSALSKNASGEASPDRPMLHIYVAHPQVFWPPPGKIHLWTTVSSFSPLVTGRIITAIPIQAKFLPGYSKTWLPIGGKSDEGVLGLYLEW